MTSAPIPASSGPRVAGNEVLLEVRDIRTEFADGEQSVVAVRNVSFDLRRFERLAIVGESGSGKSALARSLMWLIEPPGRIAGGSIHLEGRPLHTLSRSQWRGVRGNDIALVFQDPMSGFDPLCSVGRQIVEAIRVHRPVSRAVARREAIDLLRDVEIPFAERRFDDRPYEFSGGMRQRAMIAMALANSPKVLIADEPTTALDTTTQAKVLRLMRRLTEERGAAVILISHDIGVVAQLCDTVQVMYGGRIVERGPTVEVLSSPRHRYTEALLESVVRRDRIHEGPLPSIPGAPPDLRVLPSGCAFEPRCRVGHGRAECLETVPSATGFETKNGTVTVKCHFPAEPNAAKVVPAPALPTTTVSRS